MPARTGLLSFHPQFLELAVGFREGRPLPPPAAAATSLRERALELVERWAAEHGGRHGQLSLGHHYLKNTLKMQVPSACIAAARLGGLGAVQQMGCGPRPGQARGSCLRCGAGP